MLTIPLFSDSRVSIENTFAANFLFVYAFFTKNTFINYIFLKLNFY